MAKKGHSRNQKAEIYKSKYSHIPVGYNERLAWLYDELKITPENAQNIIMKRDMMMSSYSFYDLDIVLFEVPEGSPRPRARQMTRANMGAMAAENPNYIHIYSLQGKEDQVYMKRLMNSELIQLDGLIYTPCVVDICTFSETPKMYSKEDRILAEIGLERPLSKPDWDNIEKKYSDMFNKNVWIDDTYVVDGGIHKYYSVLPRLEIRIRYMNMVYNRYQRRNIIERYGVSEDEAPMYPT